MNRIRLYISVNLIIFFNSFSVGFAATIHVDATNAQIIDDGFCSISEAIISANNDSAVYSSPGECVSGAGHDTIHINSNIVVSKPHNINTAIGPSATPYITSQIDIEGNNHSIERADSDIVRTPFFRIFTIDETGIASFRNLHVKKGYNHLGANYGGGAINNRGVLSIDSCIFDNNFSEIKGGVILNSGLVEQVINSEFLQNNVNDYSIRGSVIYNQGDILEISKSTFTENYGYSVIENRWGIESIVKNTFSFNLSTPIINPRRIRTISYNTFYGNTNENNLSSSVVSTGPLTSLGRLSYNIMVSDLDNPDCSGVPHFSFWNLIDEDDSNELFACGYVGKPIFIDHELRDNGCSKLLPNGGCTRTHAILDGSNAINPHINTFFGQQVPAEINKLQDDEQLQDDQRGFIKSGFLDIGSYDAQYWIGIALNATVVNDENVILDYYLENLGVGRVIDMEFKLPLEPIFGPHQNNHFTIIRGPELIYSPTSIDIFSEYTGIPVEDSNGEERGIDVLSEGSYMDVGEKAHIQLEIQINKPINGGYYITRAGILARPDSPTAAYIGDGSDDGTNPDENGNSRPDDEGEGDYTVFRLDRIFSSGFE